MAATADYNSPFKSFLLIFFFFFLGEFVDFLLKHAFEIMHMRKTLCFAISVHNGATWYFRGRHFITSSWFTSASSCLHRCMTLLKLIGVGQGLWTWRPARRCLVGYSNNATSLQPYRLSLVLWNAYAFCCRPQDEQEREILTLLIFFFFHTSDSL